MHVEADPDWLDLGLFVAGGVMFMIILVWWK
jgi:hypothetical protein